MSDERLKKDLSAGGRESRATQVSQREPSQDALISSQERRRMFRSEWSQEALPTPPEIPGFHLCWLSSTNAYDPIHKRMRMGYQPVKADELTGFESFRVKAGEHTGLVACNEMILHKMPLDLYQDIMSELHHYAPQEESDKIRSQVEQLQGARDSSGRRLATVEGDGMGQLDAAVPAPVFS